jgi:hypothetical protein
LGGEIAGLLTAVTFTALLNLMLVASFIWPEFLPVSWLVIGWLLVACSWCFSAWRSFRWLSETYDRQGGRCSEDLFIQAQSEYLSGHWCEAESLLQRVNRDGRDVEAHLMLASLYRHTKRFAEARGRLRLLERLDGAEKWRSELEREQRLLDRLEAVRAVGVGAGAATAGSIGGRSRRRGFER